MTRRALLALPLLAGCSVLPDRPFIETRRFTLAPQRPETRPRGNGARPALLLRTLRAVPGLESRGLQQRRADGSLEIAPYDEWLAPPADLAEAALREWLIAARIFAAIAAPGTRLPTPLVLEAQLTALQTEPGLARAGLSALLLGADGARVISQRSFEATTPLPANADANAQANAMQTALGAVFGELETWLAARR